jgi:hypothetical protein
VLLRTKVADLPKNTKWESLAQVQDYVQQQQSRLTPVNRLLGEKLNFFHRVVGVIGLCIAVYVAVSLPGRPDPEKARLVWTDLGGHAPQDLRDLLAAITVSICVFTLLGWLMVIEKLSPETAAWLAAAWTLSMYLRGIRRRWKNQQADDDVAAVGPLRVILADDRFWAGILCAAAVFMHFYFY